MITYLRNCWFPGDHEFDSSNWRGSEEGHFHIVYFYNMPDDWLHTRCKPLDYGDEWVILEDRHRHRFKPLSQSLLRKFHFHLERWYHTRLAYELQEENAMDVWDESDNPNVEYTVWGYLLFEMNRIDLELKHQSLLSVERQCSVKWGQFFDCLELNATQARRGNFVAVQQKLANICDARWKIPRTLVIVVKINGHPCRALIDMGSMRDFISTTIVDQLGLKG